MAYFKETPGDISRRENDRIERENREYRERERRSDSNERARERQERERLANQSRDRERLDYERRAATEKEEKEIVRKAAKEFVSRYQRDSNSDRVERTHNSASTNVKQSYIYEINIEYVRDPISGKIVSRSDFQRGITNSIDLTKRYTFKPNAKVTDPVSGQSTDIFTLVTDTAKRYNFNSGIAKTIETQGDTTFSDAMSRLEAIIKIGEVVAPERFNDLKNTLGFWSQATGGVAKFTTYAEIGIDITKGDFNSAAENILKVGLDAASASTVFWALSGSSPPIQIGATVLAGIYGGDAIISTKNFLSKYSHKDLTPTLSEQSHYNQSNTPGKLRIINQVDNLKQSISIENKKGAEISSTGTIKIEPAQIILLGKE